MKKKKLEKIYVVKLQRKKKLVIYNKFSKISVPRAFGIFPAPFPNWQGRTRKIRWTGVKFGQTAVVAYYPWVGFGVGVGVGWG